MSSGSRASYAITTTARWSPGPAGTTFWRTPACGTICAGCGPGRRPVRASPSPASSTTSPGDPVGDSVAYSATESPVAPGARRAGVAGQALPQRQVDLRAQLGEPRGVLAIALGERLAQVRPELRSATAGLPVLQQAVGRLRRRVDAEEAPGAFHLTDRILDAALELDDEDLLARKEREHVAKLLEVEAPPRRVPDRGQPHPLSPLVSHPLEPGGGGAVAGHGIAEHDEQAGVRSRPVEQRDRPEVQQVARRPLADELTGRPRKQGRVLGGDVVGSVSPPEAVEVVNLLAERGAPDQRMATHRVIPPARPAALGSDPDVGRRTRLPPGRAFGDLQGRVPGPQPVHKT